jgi:hypothetical protein
MSNSRSPINQAAMISSGPDLPVSRFAGSVPTAVGAGAVRQLGVQRAIGKPSLRRGARIRR